jgi:hypothetical protein
MIARLLEVSDVPDMEQVEATIGHNELPASCSHGRSPPGKIIPGDDFLVKMHSSILWQFLP